MTSNEYRYHDNSLSSHPFLAKVHELLDKHLDHLRASGISPDVIRERGYKSILGKAELKALGFSEAQLRTPGILIPLWGVDGHKVGCAYRPDNPRTNSRGKETKYENVPRSSLRLDCPPRCKDKLDDPSVPLWITEGVKKEDALASHALCVVGLSGVWGFKGKNQFGGVTLLADWDEVALNGRKVYIVFDSDVMVKPEVQQALERLTEHLRRKGAKVYHVFLPSDSGVKVGVDDYLLRHTADDLIKLAVDAPEEVAPLSIEVMLARVLNDVEAGRLQPAKAVSMLRGLNRVPLYVRRALISRVVITVLSRCGRFIKNSGDRFYFHNVNKQLLELDSFEFGALLNELFGLNQTEQEFKFVLADLNTTTHHRGEETQVHRFAYYSRADNVLHVDRFDGQMYRLDGQSIELVDNGAEGVLFTKRPEWKPYCYTETAPPNGALTQTLVDDIPFQKDSFAPLMPNQQRMVFSLWILSLFFESLLPTKPILALVGEKGSGKTTALRRVLRLFFGPDADVTGLERQREDAFVAAITHGYLVVFDNLDGKMAWVNDRLAVAATGSVIQRRRLYTTNEVAIYRPRCFLAITSRNPQFRRDDVVDRLILLKVDRLHDFLPESELLDRIDSCRDFLWSELLNDLNHIVASLRQASGKPTSQFRMSDWATLCWRIAQLQEVGSEFDDILRRLSVEQSAFLLEDDPLYLCLMVWLENSTNQDRELDCATLYSELSEIANRQQIEWSYKSTMSLAKRLSNVKSNLEQLLQFSFRDDNRRRRYYNFKPLVPVHDEVTR